MSGGVHGAVTVVLSAVVAALGVAMIVTAIAGGGGPASRGMLVGALFLLAGGGRLWLATRRDLDRDGPERDDG